MYIVLKDSNTISKRSNIMNNINFVLTREQAEDICKHYGKDITKMEDWEIEELLDRLIDEFLFG